MKYRVWLEPEPPKLPKPDKKPETPSFKELIKMIDEEEKDHGNIQRTKDVLRHGLQQQGR